METIATHELNYARWPRRALSAFIDYFVVSFVSTPFTGQAISHVQEAFRDDKVPEAADIARVFVAILVVVVVYSTALHTWRGSTFGKMAARTVVVMEDGSKITPQVAFVRAVAFATLLSSSFLIGLLVPVVGLVPMLANELRPLWHPLRQTFHDQIAHTVVVRA